MNPESPCIALCKLTEDDTCAGCKRTIDEIVNWRTYTDIEKNAVFARIKSLGKDTPAQP